MSLLTNIVGFTATVVGTCLMLPQLIKAIRTKKMNDVSSGMIAAYIANCFLWDFYGILIGSVPLILCNSIALCIAVAQAFLKRKYG